MYIHRYFTPIDYQVIETFPGGERPIANNQHDYLDWLAADNVPMIEAAGRFLSVIDGKLIVDPNKDMILAAEEAARVEATIKAKLREIDISSIRSLREYVASKADAPQYLKDYEAAAVTERRKL